MKFYVYEHWRPDLDLPFYVGKGSGRRAHRMDFRNKTHLSIQAELAANGLCVEVRLVKGMISSDEAFALEKQRIAFWRNSGVALANIASGGGRDFLLPRPNWSERMSIAASNQSAETRAKRSRSMTGLVRSEQTRSRISAAKTNPSDETRHRNRAATIQSWANPKWRANQIAKRIGMVRITDGTENRMICPDEEIPAGWRRGMVKAACMA